MRKIKIFITIFALYELITLTVLQVNNYCNAFFSSDFCASGSFKYFVMDIMIPILFGLIFWWCPYRKECQCNNQVQNNNDKQNIENMIVGALVSELKNLLQSPKIKKMFNNWFGTTSSTKK